MLILFAVVTAWSLEVTSEEEAVKPSEDTRGFCYLRRGWTGILGASPRHSLVAMGRTGKLPSGVSGKLKRWKKGHSSDSNPATCRHRQAARSRFFSRPSGSPAFAGGVLVVVVGVMVRMSTLEITSKAGPSSLTDSGTVPRREMTCLGYRGVRVGIHGHHYSWWLFRVLCVWRGVLGPEPRVCAL